MWEKYCRTRQATNDNIIRRMRIACWIPKASDIHSEYVILIAFPLLQWLHERAWNVTLYVHWLSCFVPDYDSFITQKSRICRDHVRMATVFRNTIQDIRNKNNIKMDVERERGEGYWFRLTQYDVAEDLQWKRSESSGFLKRLG